MSSIYAVFSDLWVGREGFESLPLRKKRESAAFCGERRRKPAFSLFSEKEGFESRRRDGAEAGSRKIPAGIYV